LANGHSLHNRAFRDSDQLPENYGVTQITLITRDPHWIYAYWDISPEIRKRMNGSIVLRMYDVSLIDFNGQNANSSFDIDVGNDASNWYIQLWNDHVSYCCDLGTRSSEGHFHPLARSNVVTTQRREWANRFEANWAEVKQGKNGCPEFIPESPAVARLAAVNPFQNQKESRFEDPEKTAPTACLSAKLLEQTKKKRQWRKPLSVDEILAYYSRLFPRLRRTKPGLIKRLKQKGLLDQDAVENGNGNGNGKAGLFPQPIPDVHKNIFFKRSRFGASAEFEEKGGASEQKGGASESLGGGSELVYKKRKFFFELYAELIVYGRTEPDATVHWGDRKIPLRPDGTFSFRFALPDTHIPLNFTAESADKIKLRNITTAVERFKTNYSTKFTRAPEGHGLLVRG
jgi:hypothetical protein